MKRIYYSLFAAFTALSVPSTSRAQCVTATNIMTVAGNHTVGYSGDGGAGTAAQIGSPYCVASDADGNFYIADYFNNAVRKVSSTGTITTIAGTGVAGYNGDGIPADVAQLWGPAGLALDASGNLYIADKFNERIRKVDAITGMISTIAGDGYHGGWQGHGFGNDGPATAACLTFPISIALDCNGNMYIADVGSETVRKIDNMGIITRFAGTHKAGYNGDMIAATAAELYQPTCVAADCDGNVYISDTWNNRIRKVDITGTISTIAGNGLAAYAGDGGDATAASLFGPWGITLDACNNLYICDYDNNAVRKVNTSGTISTFAGSNSRGYTGDGGAATESEIYLPSSLAIDGSDNVYIADYGNLVVRLVGSVNYQQRRFAGGTTQELSVCQNSTSISIDKLMSIPDVTGGKTETWTVSGNPEHGTLSGFNATVESKGGMVTPSGLSYTPEAGFAGEDEFTVLMTDGTTSASTTISLVVKPTPNAGIITGAVLSGNTASLANVTGDAGGVWSSSDNTIAQVDATGHLTALSNGVVTIAYTVNNGCGEKSATATIVSEINEIPAGKALVFPNPTTGAFRVDFESELDGALQLTATDITGRVVYSENVNVVAGINTVKINLPATIQRPSVLRISLGNEKAKKYETVTIMVTE